MCRHRHSDNVTSFATTCSTAFDFDLDCLLLELLYKLWDSIKKVRDKSSVCHLENWGLGV